MAQTITTIRDKRVVRFNNLLLIPISVKPDGTYEYSDIAYKFEKDNYSNIGIKYKTPDKQEKSGANGIVDVIQEGAKSAEITLTKWLWNTPELIKVFMDSEELLGGGVLFGGDAGCMVNFVLQYTVQYNKENCNAPSNEASGRQFFNCSMPLPDEEVENPDTKDGVKDNSQELVINASLPSDPVLPNRLGLMEHLDVVSGKYVQWTQGYVKPALVEAVVSAITATGATITVKNLIPDTQGKTNVIVEDIFGNALTTTPVTPTGDTSVFTLTGATAVTKYYVFSTKLTGTQTVKNKVLTTFETITTK